MTAFHVACVNGDTKIVQMLMKKSIEHSIDLNARDVNGNTAFHMACFFGKSNIIKIIEESANFYKIDLSAKNNNGNTGFQVAKYNADARLKFNKSHFNSGDFVRKMNRLNPFTDNFT